LKILSLDKDKFYKSFGSESDIAEVCALHVLLFYRIFAVGGCPKPVDLSAFRSIMFFVCNLHGAYK